MPEIPPAPAGLGKGGAQPMTKGTIIGIDIGGTKTAIIRGTRKGAILHRYQFPTAAHRGFPAVFEDIARAVRNALTDGGEDVCALSVSVGGPLDVLSGIIKIPPNLPGCYNVPLKKLLSDRFHLPVYVEHDGNAGALAEFYFGAGRGCSNVVFITMGTGFGAGLILGGRLYRGTNDVAGEIGHIRVAEDGPEAYGKRGSLEGYASGTGIAKLAVEMYPERWPAATAPDLYSAFRAGSAEARAVFARASMALGRGLAIIADTLNPERIILGGIGMRMWDALVEPACAVLREEALPEAVEVCRVVPAALGESIGDLAALCAALDQGDLLER